MLEILIEGVIGFLIAPYFSRENRNTATLLKLIETITSAPSFLFQYGFRFQLKQRSTY